MEQNVQERVVIKPDNNMALAIFTTICCCLPLGIVAIIKANSVDTLYAMKQYDAAFMASNEAKKWCYWGILINVIIWVVYIVTVGLLGFGGFAFLNGML